MNKQFLSTLYFKLFEATQEEQRLMGFHDWEDSEEGHIANNRNDQQISDLRKHQQVLQELIDRYLQLS